MSFSLSSQINNLQRKSSIWAPLNGLIDDFVTNHQHYINTKKAVTNKITASGSKSSPYYGDDAMDGRSVSWAG